jgi:hypothetical protein
MYNVSIGNKRFRQQLPTSSRSSAAVHCRMSQLILSGHYDALKKSGLKTPIVGTISFEHRRLSLVRPGND